MTNKNSQKGVGLLEVLVALMLLAIAVLGFVALQLRSVEATAEGFNRIQAMNIARDLAEKMRINNSDVAITAYKTALASVSSQQSNTSSCYSSFCQPEAKAGFDVHESYVQANNAGMTLNMISCPATENRRQCIYVAWGKTDPVDSTPTVDGHSACTTTTGTVNNAGFSYVDNSTCIVMEAY